MLPLLDSGPANMVAELQVKYLPWLKDGLGGYTRLTRSFKECLNLLNLLSMVNTCIVQHKHTMSSRIGLTV
jgi:hypothetical protein